MPWGQRRRAPRNRDSTVGQARSPGSPNAYALALGFLSRRELTTSELRERLARRELPAQDIDAALARLASDGTLDDRRAAAAIARTQAVVKGRGRSRVARELAARGVSNEVAAAALDEVFRETPEPDLLERALRRRLRTGHITDQAQFRRLFQYLLRLGFPAGAIVSLLKKHSRVDVD